MCLLFQKPAHISFDDDQLADMYSSNRDGYGVMYAEGGYLYTQKGIGSVQDWIKFFRKHEHRMACFHLRMRTHGDIDLTNTHPYPVWGFEKGQEDKTPVAMMHNGILSTGNSKDPSKSDTWHYIRNWIRPLSEFDQRVLFTPQMGKLLEDHIGSSNKFAIMDALGNCQIVNRSAGIEWNEVWFSNTYAWSSRSEKLYPGIMKSHKTGYTTYGGYGSYTGGSKRWELNDDDRYNDYWDTRTPSKKGGKTAANTADKVTVKSTISHADGSKTTVYSDGSRSTTPAPKSTAGTGTANLPMLPSNVPSNVTQLPNKTSPKGAAGNGNDKRAEREQSRPNVGSGKVEGKTVIDADAIVGNGLSERDEKVIQQTVSSMFKTDVNYVRATLRSVASWISNRLTDRVIEDNVSKFGVDALVDLIGEHQRGYVFGVDLEDGFLNHDKMKGLICKMYGINPDDDLATGHAISEAAKKAAAEAQAELDAEAKAGVEENPEASGHPYVH